ncbi:Hypothetical predicted protein [Xyrichtys novacula]|uniref:Uncharacterized protein n=1 Tax=Xyrichtys novacula TaxID=13765 RepID=A0AAV1FQY7_XYRNO|nr:Hypothetical predicted protein [Xyrichtys novacula]
MRHLQGEKERRGREGGFVETKLLLENGDRHLREGKERSDGNQRVEGIEKKRRRRRETEGGEELKRRGGDETGEGGPEERRERGRYGGPQTDSRSSSSSV